LGKPLGCGEAIIGTELKSKVLIENAFQ